MPARNRQSGIPAPVGVKDPAAQKTLWALYERLNQDDATARNGSGSRRSGAGAGGTGGASAGTGGNNPRPVRPNPPENLEASGIFGAILLEVDALPPSAAAIEWLAAPEDDLSQAVVVGQSPVPLFRHYVGDNATRWYWAKAVGFGQSPLRSGVNQTAGTRGQSAQNVDLILDNLNKQIGRDQLIDDVTSTIDLVTAGPDTPGSVAARTQAVRQDLSDRADAIDAAVEQTRTDLDSSTDELRGRISNNRLYVDDLYSELQGDLEEQSSAIGQRADGLRRDLDASVDERRQQVDRLTTDLSQEIQDRIRANETARVERQSETEQRISEDDAVIEALTTMFAVGGSTDPVYWRSEQVPDNPPPGAYRIQATDSGPELQQYANGVWAAVTGFDSDSIRATIGQNEKASQDRDSALSERTTLLEAGLTDADRDIAAASNIAQTAQTETERNAEGIQTNAQQIDASRSDILNLETGQQTQSETLTSLSNRATQTEERQEAQGQRLESVESGLQTAQDGIELGASAREGLDSRVTATEEAAEALSNRATAVESGLSDAQQEQNAQGASISALQSQTRQQGDTLTQQSNQINAANSRIDQLGETGAENLLGADADDEAPAKTVTLPLANTTLEPGDVVSAYGEIKHGSGVSVGFVLAALDSAGNVLTQKVTGGVGGTDYEAAKVQGFEIPESAATLRLSATAGTARFFSINPGPLAVVFRAPSATAESVGEIRSLTQQQGDELEAVSEDLSRTRAEVGDIDARQRADSDVLDATTSRSVQNADGLSTQGARLTEAESNLRSLDQQAQANTRATDELKTESAQNAAGLSTQGRRLQTIDSQLSRDKAISLVTPPGKSISPASRGVLQGRSIQSNTVNLEQTAEKLEGTARDVSDLQLGLEATEENVAANGQATDALDLRVTSTEEGVQSVGEDLFQVTNRVSDNEAQQTASADAIDGILNDVEEIDGRLRSTLTRTTDLESRVSAFKLAAEWGFENGEAGRVAAPTGWELEGDPQIATYYLEAPEGSDYGSKLAYGNDGTGVSPGAWGIQKTIRLNAGGGDLKLTLKTRVLSGFFYPLFLTYDSEGQVINEIAGNEVQSGFDGRVSLEATMPGNATHVDIHLRASRLVEAA